MNFNERIKSGTKFSCELWQDLDNPDKGSSQVTKKLSLLLSASPPIANSENLKHFDSEAFTSVKGAFTVTHMHTLDAIIFWHFENMIKIVHLGGLV